jgi:hypothetical protein
MVLLLYRDIDCELVYSVTSNELKLCHFVTISFEPRLKTNIICG